MAILTARPGSTPRWSKMNVRMGTISMPPPMPSRPARKPAARPRASSSASEAGRHPRSRCSTACHSVGVTGVMDSRLPRCSTCMPASSGASRISLRLSNRVVSRQRTSTCTQRGAARLGFRVEVRAGRIELGRVRVRRRCRPLPGRRCQAPGRTSGRKAHHRQAASCRA